MEIGQLAGPGPQSRRDGSRDFGCRSEIDAGVPVLQGLEFKAAYIPRLQASPDPGISFELHNDP